MNPLTQVRQIKKINESELALGIAGDKKSWHDVYKNSAWIFVGGLSFELTEGDVISVFSQYGEVVNMNLVRDPKTGKSRGFAFICYEDQRSTVLAVDNLNGIKLTGRTIRVDHVANYKPPKEKDETDELTRLIYERGCGPEINMSQLENEAAKREANKAFDRKSGDKRSSERSSWRRDRDRREDNKQIKSEFGDDRGDFSRRDLSAQVKAEYDDDGDVRRSNIKVEANYDDDGDVRRGPPPPPVGYDTAGDICRAPVIKREHGDDGDVAVSSKRRSIESSSKQYESSRRYEKEGNSREDRRHDRSSSKERHRSHHHRR